MITPRALMFGSMKKYINPIAQGKSLAYSQSTSKGSSTMFLAVRLDLALRSPWGS